jgi:CDP-diacylglycerol--serine O-phosphatidyltransferase
MAKKIPLLPNIITAFGLSCGLFVIFRMTLTEPGESDYQRVMTSVMLLIVAAFADLLDGFIARAMKAESEFGGVFDCLADAISFGVAPAVLILKSVSQSTDTRYAHLIMIASMVFAVCGVLRLVRFAVTSQLEKEDKEAREASKKHFTGLPIPAGCAAAVSADLVLISPDAPYWFAPETRVLILFLLLLFLGYLMISRWKFFSFKTLNIRVASFQVVLLTAISAVLIFYGILQHFAFTLFAIAWLYVIVALSLSMTRYFAGKRVQQLEDFEPEPESDLENEE